MKIFLTIAAIMVLLIGTFIVYGATSDTTTAAASVTVNTFVDITLTDRGDPGILFGSLDPGVLDSKEVAQNGLGAVNFSVQATTNKASVNVKLKGTDFTETSNTLTIDHVTADDDNTLDSGNTGASNITLATTDKILTTLSPDTNVEIFFFIDVPTAQTAAAYTSTFSFTGD